MILDSHCHAWRLWPYEPPVPDPESRGVVAQLLFEMDQGGVDQAVIVCARIDHNPDNNDYVAASVRAFPHRLHQFADVDCAWATTYHAPGAADRLSRAIEAYDLKGFTHYVRAEDDGSWFLSDEGQAFWRVAAENHQIVSLSIGPRLQATVRRVAEMFPSLALLCHHMAGARVGESADFPALHAILESARWPNINIKLSGFHYVSNTPWGFPYADCEPVVRALYEHFGPERLCWGSDYPVVRRSMTYRQSLEVVRSHCTFIPEPDRELILGASLARLLARSGRPH